MRKHMEGSGQQVALKLMSFLPSFLQYFLWPFFPLSSLLASFLPSTLRFFGHSSLFLSPSLLCLLPSFLWSFFPLSSLPASFLPSLLPFFQLPSFLLILPSSIPSPFPFPPSLPPVLPSFLLPSHLSFLSSIHPPSSHLSSVPPIPAPLSFLASFPRPSHPSIPPSSHKSFPPPFLPVHLLSSSSSSSFLPVLSLFSLILSLQPFSNSLFSPSLCHFLFCTLHPSVLLSLSLSFCRHLHFSLNPNNTTNHCQTSFFLPLLLFPSLPPSLLSSPPLPPPPSFLLFLWRNQTSHRSQWLLLQRMEGWSRVWRRGDETEEEEEEEKDSRAIHYHWCRVKGRLGGGGVDGGGGGRQDLGSTKALACDWTEGKWREEGRKGGRRGAGKMSRAPPHKQTVLCSRSANPSASCPTT